MIEKDLYSGDRGGGGGRVEAVEATTLAVAQAVLSVVVEAGRASS